MLHKKSLGQHFLRDPKILGKMVVAGDITREDTVLEIGPGEGTLTKLLLARAGKVVAVEKDDRLIPVLQETFSKEIASGALKLIHGDILTAPLDFLPSSSKEGQGGGWDSTTPPQFSPLKGEEEKRRGYKLVANIPYYITGEILRLFLSGDCQPSRAVLLVQKEVAKRIVASEGKESILSLSVKAYGTPRYIDTVKAGAFSPPPKVNSAILAVEHISKDFFETLRETQPYGVRLSPTEVEKQFFLLVKKGFAHKRKLLRSNLKLSPEMLESAGIQTDARAETLTIEHWNALALSIQPKVNP